MRKKRANVFIAYGDQLLLILVYVIYLVVVAQKADGLKPEAEFIITASWDNRLDTDVDLWGLPPVGADGQEHPVYYSNRDHDALFLDRDSRGYLTDRERKPDGQYVDTVGGQVL